jgi:hypothetical protein
MPDFNPCVRQQHFLAFSPLVDAIALQSADDPPMRKKSPLDLPANARSVEIWHNAVEI